MRKIIGISLLTPLFVGWSNQIELPLNVVDWVSPPLTVEAKEPKSGWYLRALGVDVAHNYGLTGKGVTIAVLDSGISFKDESLSKRVIASYDCSEGLEQENGRPVLVSDHGTKVASIIVSETTGIAPGVNLMDFNVALSGVENANISGKGVVQAYQKILELLDSGVKIDIVQMSYGFEKPSESSQKLLGEIASRGVILVASSGNEGEEAIENQIQYPAAYEDVIAVGSITDKMVRAKSSSYGAFVDIAAPGSHIDVLLRDGTHGYASGTSMAAPMVSGILALYKEAYPSASNKEIVQMLFENAKDLGLEGKDIEYGYGLATPLPPERIEVNEFLSMNDVFTVYEFANSATSPHSEMVLNGEFNVTKAKGWLQKEKRYEYYYFKDIGWIQPDDTFQGLANQSSSFMDRKVEVPKYDRSAPKEGYAARLSEVCKLYVNQPEFEGSPSSSRFFGSFKKEDCETVL